MSPRASPSPRLHVAVDARDLARDARGIGRYTRELLRRFAARDDVRLTLLTREFAPLAALRFARALGGRRPSHVGVAGRVPRDADVAWHPWNGAFFESARPCVATIHDVVPFAFPAADARRRTAEQAPFLRSAAAASIVLTDSAFSADEIERHLHVPRARLRVVPLAAGAAFSPGTPATLPAVLRARRYALYVGTLEPRKNAEVLMVAHARAFPNGELLLAMRGGERLPASTHVITVGSLGEDALIDLYRGATLVAVPSVYEGFGLPVLEAMACGAPVVASRRSSLPEVGGDAPYWIDEAENVDAWVAALRAVMENTALRDHLRRRGLARAAAFTWERCAEATLETLRCAANRH